LRFLRFAGASKSGVSAADGKTRKDFGREGHWIGLRFVVWFTKQSTKRLRAGGGTIGIMGILARGVVQSKCNSHSFFFLHFCYYLFEIQPQKKKPTTTTTTTTITDGGRVKGFIPKALAPKEISGEHVGDTVLVDDMHSRKIKMYQQANAFIGIAPFQALPSPSSFFALHTFPVLPLLTFLSSFCLMQHFLEALERWKS
jgi:hypothetical protein